MQKICPVCKRNDANGGSSLDYINDAADGRRVLWHHQNLLSEFGLTKIDNKLLNKPIYISYTSNSSHTDSQKSYSTLHMCFCQNCANLAEEKLVQTMQAN
jgi:hypothetical protein